MTQQDSKFYLCLRGKNFEHTQFKLTLGPWTKREQAEAYSDSLTDSRIGEQLMQKLGVEELIVLES
jgi:hypothetical protein